MSVSIELLYAAAPFMMGAALVSWPAGIGRFAFRRSERMVVGICAGVASAIGLHLLFTALSYLDPVNVPTVGAASVDLFRLGGYPLLGWLPMIGAAISLVFGLVAMKRRPL
jgi:hypothetical protein